MDLSNFQPEPVPMLLLLEESHGQTKHSLLNPILNTSVLKTFPELNSHQVHCLASAHGWILLVSRETSSLFFLNPFTGTKLDLPYRRSVFSAAAFSAPPDSPNCAVFAVYEEFLRGKIYVDVLRFRHEENWTRYGVEVVKDGKRKFGVVTQAVCCNGILYCLDSRGRVASWDPNLEIWKVICEVENKKLRHSCFLEFKGGLFAVENGTEETYKLKVEEDDGKAQWEAVKEDLETENKGPNHMFLGPYGSCGVSNLGVKWHGKTWPSSGPLQTPIWITRSCSS